MAKAQTRFVCQQCGSVSPKWAGRCDGCGGWNTLAEETVAAGPPKSLDRSGSGKARGQRLTFSSLTGDSREMPRRTSGIAEFDRVCGGGMVPGSALLVGGDPGIGKSTVLLQVLAALASGQGGPRRRCAYISGEESLDQVRLRASRLEVEQAPVELAAATSIRDIALALDHADATRYRGHRLDPDHVSRHARQRAGHGGPGPRLGAGAHPPRQAARLLPSCWWATSPRKGSSPVRACSSTWSTPCSISRASAATSSASCARSRTASGRPTRSACSR